MEFTQEQIDRHNGLTKAGTAIVKSHALIEGGGARGVPGFFERRQLKEGIRLFSEALKINPAGWSSMWALGKLHQRLGEHAEALRWFAEAARIKPDQADVLREAGIAALNIGAKDEALRLCFAAVQLAPDDLGLQSNLALAYLMTGDDVHAEECATVAVSRAPQDTASHGVLRLVQEVRQGKRRRPERLMEAS